MAKTNYNFKTDRYESYEEKIAELKNIFGSWPPPFDPVWAVQLSQGRCGSNGLWSIVNSFFEGAIKDPTFEEMDDPRVTSDISQKNWVPENGQKYLYYNVHGRSQHRIHFPVLFWFLTNSPKIVHLTRSDHLTRAISIFYANLIFDAYIETGDVNLLNQPDKSAKLYSHPIDFDKMDEYIKISFIEIEVIKSIVSEFVSEDRLRQVTHQEVFHTDVLNTLRCVAQFLECDTLNSSATIRLHKETRYHLIPNIDEVMEHYQRDLSEQDFWLPEDFDVDSAQNEIEEEVQNLIRLNTNEMMRLNLPPFSDRKTVFIKIKEEGIALENRPIELPVGEFYIDKIPTSAKFMPFPEFRNLPNMSLNIQMLDDRWETLEWTSPRHLREFTEVTNIQKNWNRSTYTWVCGFSAFFLKIAYDGHEERTLPEEHQRLIRGVEALCSHPDRYEDMVLRFYVSDEVWEILHKSEILYHPGTEFHKMAFSSEESALGTIWRMLCLSDDQFEYAIETDVAPDEDWIFMRIRGNGLEDFKNLLMPDKDYMAEFLFWEHNWYGDEESQNFQPDHIRTPHVFWDIGNLDFASTGGITTRPNQMPDIESLLLRCIENYATQRTFYHADKDVWSTTHQQKFFIPYGWEGFTIDQEFWRYLKKVKPIRHFLNTKSIKHIQKTHIHENHVMLRIIRQLISEGSEFVHFKTKENVFKI